jgi:hypothetical protein
MSAFNVVSAAAPWGLPDASRLARNQGPAVGLFVRALQVAAVSGPARGGELGSGCLRPQDALWAKHPTGTSRLRCRCRDICRRVGRLTLKRGGRVGSHAGTRSSLVWRLALAEMLGVGRTFVTRIVRQLRDEGVLDTRRGVFIVKDETALRQKSCRCTTSIEDHFDTVLHGIYPLD